MATRSAVRPDRSLMMLTRVRRALRAVTTAIERGSGSVGITRQEQAVLLGLAAHGGSHVPLADVRAELAMDQATASVLLRRLIRERYLVRGVTSDRRAAQLSLTPKGWTTFRRSMNAIRQEMREVARRGEVAPLRTELSTYIRFYAGAAADAPRRARGKRTRARASA